MDSLNLMAPATHFELAVLATLLVGIISFFAAIYSVSLRVKWARWEEYQTSSLLGPLRKLQPFLSLATPRNSIKVQFCLAVCILCMAGERLLSFAIPRQAGIVAERLSTGEIPYMELMTYMFLCLLHDESGFGLVVSWARIPIRQHFSRQIITAGFNHVMSLSAEYHADMNAAEVMKTIEQGGALTDAFEGLLLDILPTLADICVALVVFYVKFNWTVSAYMIGVTALFVVFESLTASCNTLQRRMAAQLQRKESSTMQEVLQSWQTVAAFDTFAYEQNRFNNVLDARLHSQGEYERRNALVRSFRQGLVPISFFLLSCLVTRDICLKQLSPADFAFLTQYWEYLIWPIKLLSHSYRRTLGNIIDAEQFLHLLKYGPKMDDKENAVHLVRGNYVVAFKRVCFSYDGSKHVLRDIDILVRPGETVAIVGASGSGKSSLMKLLMRLYKPNSGNITIGGHDIGDVTLSSLRDFIAVVPQTPQLFNASVMDNVRYARLTASDEEVFAACRAAAIHDEIVSLQNGYRTIVGENGARLSGGEMQRLAIARAFLKDSAILILDEATSCIDTNAESKVCAAISSLGSKRTKFMIAHRLHTAIGADQILVLSGGKIVERGTHWQLMELEGEYKSLWQKMPS
ncbi:hypothetical protein NQ176_g7493 [Zarea fungicola]|uniref:Uncharacterized protein n=1 Tax=Zarea fungicola TaxID=93591 RepID=A0ACC1MYM5_9HYPO|nr:hypothetical protein NQ176_g7493 [Lecanicillium fungicola]